MRAARMMQPVAPRGEGAGAVLSPQVNGRHPFVGVRMADGESARAQERDGGVYLGVGWGHS